jgi:hypothetical protein
VKTAFATAALLLLAPASYADPLTCDLGGYKVTAGLAAAVSNDALTLTWAGDNNQDLRLRLIVNGGTPTIRDLAVRTRHRSWSTIATNVTPEHRAVSGVRRITTQQLWPLRQMGAEITQAVLDKYALAISETYRKAWGDDIYANNPVNYAKLDRLPDFSTFGAITRALKRGDYFVTTGEVLISNYEVAGAGDARTIAADVEWTFPLEFAEMVWGDGTTIERQIIPATHLPPFGRHRFEIPFDAAGTKWVRFAVWDSAGNRAFVQPIKLHGGTTTTARQDD